MIGVVVIGVVAIGVGVVVVAVVVMVALLLDGFAGQCCHNFAVILNPIRVTHVGVVGIRFGHTIVHGMMWDGSNWF